MAEQIVCDNAIHGGADFCHTHQPTVDGSANKVLFNGMSDDFSVVGGEGIRKIVLCEACADAHCERCMSCDKKMAGTHFLAGFEGYCSKCIGCRVVKQAAFRYRKQIMDCLPKGGEAREIMKAWFETDIDDDEDDACFIEVFVGKLREEVLTTRQYESARKRISELISQDALKIALELEDD